MQISNQQAFGRSVRLSGPTVLPQLTYKSRLLHIPKAAAAFNRIMCGKRQQLYALSFLAQLGCKANWRVAEK